MQLTIKIFGTLATIFSLIGFLPQIYRTYKTKSAEDISELMLITRLHALLVGSFMV